MRLQLLLKADKLPDCKGKYSWKPKKQPNSFCVVSNVSDIGSVLGIKRRLLGATEVVPQCSSPEWATVLSLEHTRGTEHRIAIDIFHSNLPIDSEQTHKMEHSERRGHLHVNHAQQLCGILLDIETVLSNRDYILTEKLAHGCSITVRLEPLLLQEHDDARLFKFHLRGLDCQNTRLNFLDRPDFVFEIRRKQRGKTQDTWALVYRSNVAKASLNPYWNQDVVPLTTLCNGNIEREIQISVWDTPARVFLGHATTSVSGLMSAVSERGNAEKALDLSRPSNNPLHATHHQGKLVVLHASVESPHVGSSLHLATTGTAAAAASMPQESLSNLPQAVAVEILEPPRNVTFEDYMSTDKCSLELCVAIDFSRANGDFKLEGTPHYTTRGRLNDYEWSMSIVANCIGKYNDRLSIPCWGFGARFHDAPCDIFQCGSNSDNQGGARGLLQAYHGAFQTSLEFGYQCRYEKVIQAAAHYSKKQLDAAQQSNRLAYTVLLILTVGTERDMLVAKERIESISAAPLFIIFLRMDNGMHSSSPLKTNKLSDACILLEGSDFKDRQARVLAERVMEKIKPQMAEYYLSRGIYPPAL